MAHDTIGAVRLTAFSVRFAASASGMNPVAERAKVLITGRPPDEVLQEFEPWFGSSPPQFYEICSA